MTNDDLELERVEAAAWKDFYDSADDTLAARLGVRVVEFPAALLTLVSSVDVLAFNRALGIGLDAPFDAGTLDGIIDACRDAGLNRGFIQVRPGAESDDVRALLESRGLERHNGWVKLWRSVDDVPDVRTDLEIVEIGPELAAEFGEVVVRAFEWPAGVKGLVASAVGRDGWRHYVAMDGPRMAATAGLFVSGESAWLDFAATDAGARGRGAQSALLARRIVDARGAGCRRVVVETSEPRPDNPAQSNRNVMRMGFVAAYTRSNYIWHRS